MPYFALTRLSERAASDADARTALESLLRQPAGALEPCERHLAAARLACTGTAPELAALAVDVRGSSDDALLLGLARGLQCNPEAGALKHLFAGLPEIPDDDSPTPEPGD